MACPDLDRSPRPEHERGCVCREAAHTPPRLGERDRFFRRHVVGKGGCVSDDRDEKKQEQKKKLGGTGHCPRQPKASRERGSVYNLEGEKNRDAKTVTCRVVRKKLGPVNHVFNARHPGIDAVQPHSKKLAARRPLLSSAKGNSSCIPLEWKRKAMGGSIAGSIGTRCLAPPLALGGHGSPGGGVGSSLFVRLPKAYACSSFGDLGGSRVVRLPKV